MNSNSSISSTTTATTTTSTSDFWPPQPSTGATTSLLLSSNTTGGIRPLRDLSHEESIELLKQHGIASIPEDSLFFECKIKGIDLMEVREAEDLQDCGINAPKIRLRSIVTALAYYREYGVPTTVSSSGTSTNTSTTTSAWILSPSRKSTVIALDSSSSSTGEVSSVLADNTVSFSSTNSEKDQSLLNSIAAINLNTSATTTTTATTAVASVTNIANKTEHVSSLHTQGLQENGKKIEERRIGGGEKSSSISSTALVSTTTTTTTTTSKSITAEEGISLQSFIPTMSNHHSHIRKQESIDCYRLDDPCFKSLSTFDPTKGTKLRPTTISDLFPSTTSVSATSSSVHDHEGYLLPPPSHALQQQLYGYLTTKLMPAPNTVGSTAKGAPKRRGKGSKDLDTMTSNNDEDDMIEKVIIFSPYRSMYKDIPDHCGIVAIPNKILQEICCLPCSSDDNTTSTTTTTAAATLKKSTTITTPPSPPPTTTTVQARVRILIKDMLSLQFDRVVMKTFGSIRSRAKLHPEVLKQSQSSTKITVIDESIPDGKHQFHDTMYFLWHLPTMSLMSIREGLLVLIPMTTRDGRVDNGHLSLGVVYFPNNMEKTSTLSASAASKQVLQEIETTWERCRQRLINCQYENFDVKQIPLMPPRLVSFPSVTSGVNAEGNSSLSLMSKRKKRSEVEGRNFEEREYTSGVAHEKDSSSIAQSMTSALSMPVPLAPLLSSLPPLNIASFPDPIYPSAVSTGKAYEGINDVNNNQSVTFSKTFDSSLFVGLFDDLKKDDDARPTETKSESSSVSKQESISAGLSGTSAGADAPLSSHSPHLDWSAFSLSANAKPFSPATKPGAPSSWLASDTSSSPSPSPSVLSTPPVLATSGPTKNHVQGSCTFELHCKYGKGCRNGPHSEATERVFRCFKSMAERSQYKFILCTRLDEHDTRSCFLYHEDKQAHEKKKKFCIECLKPGHLSEVCRKKPQQQQQ